MRPLARAAAAALVSAVWALVVYAAMACLAAASRFVLRRVAQRTAARAFETLQPFDSFDADQWRAAGGDGLCSAYSQSHPRTPGARVGLVDGALGSVAAADATPCKAAKSIGGGAACSAACGGNAREVPAPGTWVVRSFSGDHLSVVPFPACRDVQLEFFRSHFRLLRGLRREPA